MRNFKTQGSLTSLSGGGMRDRPYATVLVSAVDSFAIGAENADYVCTGTSDHLKLQQAIDFCESGPGGRVELLEGNYNLDSNYLRIPSNVSLSGQGHGTRLNFSSENGFGIEVSGSLSHVLFVVDEYDSEVEFFCWSGDGIMDDIAYSVSGSEA